MNSQEFKDFLHEYNACEDTYKWAESLSFDPMRCWNECERGEWLLWWACRIPSLNRKLLVKAAVEVAATALPYTNDERVHKCIEVTRLWCDGRASYKELQEAADAAMAAAKAEDDAFAAAARVAAAAARAVWAAWVAWAAAMAVEFTARAAAWDATHKQHAEIVRSIIPIEAILEGGSHE